MKKYQVKPEDFFTVSQKDTTVVREAMEQLIAKYELSDKNVIAIAPGLGIEEYWFYKNGCQLTFVDIDQYGSIESLLQTLPSETAKGNLAYYIGDAYDYVKSYCDGGFQVLYISSLTIDEVRRKNIVEQNKYWPDDALPYLDLIEDCARKCVSQGGVFIYQTYYGGINPNENPHYIELVKQQLAQAGIILLHVYAFAASPGVMLTIGFKGSEREAVAYLEKIRNNPELTTFHGRSALSRQGCKTLYQLCPD